MMKLNAWISSLIRALPAGSVTNAPKSGQMVQAKVIDILPGNKAIVQIGSQRMEAQLESALTKGQSYLFQASTKDEVLHLKLISRLATTNASSFHQLLAKLGIKSSGEAADFVRSLMKMDIPFRTAEVKQALQLLEQTNEKPVAKQVLLEMFERKLPIRPAIFDALMMRRTSGMSQLIPLDTSPVTVNDKRLAQFLAQMKGTAPPLSFQESSALRIMTELSQGSRVSHSLFQKAGMTDHTYPAFQKAWQHWSGHDLSSRLTNQDYDHILNRANQEAPPLPVKPEAMAQHMKQLMDEQIPLSKSERQMFTRWVAHLSQEAPSALFSKDHQALQEKGTFQKILPLLPEAFRPAAEILVMKPPAQRNFSIPEPLLRAFQTLQAHQLPPAEKVALTEWTSRLSHEFPPQIRDGVFLKMKAMLDLSGIQDEAFLKKGYESSGSLKSTLLASLQDPQSAVRPEAARQMVSFLNGIQLTAHTETSQTLQVALQFPGEMLGAVKDIHMQMEGRKTRQGEMDADSCHILFFLSLEQIKETVIDLTIVERNVAVTVYNDHDRIESVVDTYKLALQKGLDQLGYQLGSVWIKPMNVAHKQRGNGMSTLGGKGVDFRI
ncbi:hypothetical protein EQV77_04230 [Halobacillus fulvus]|nr:hypothetical protein EQV77_04230 [Halobacillus fulvus]